MLNQQKMKEKSTPIVVGPTGTVEVEYDKFIKDEVTSPLSEEERLHRLAALRYPAIEAKSGLKRGVTEYTPVAQPAESHKQEQERLSQERAIRNETRNDRADINTIWMTELLRLHREKVSPDNIFTLKGVKSGIALMDDQYKSREEQVNGCRKKYEAMDRNRQQVFTDVSAFLNRTENHYIEGNSDDFKRMRSDQVGRMRSLLSDDRKEQAYALDKMVDRLIGYSFTTEVFETYYQKQHGGELLEIKHLVDNFDNIRTAYPEYFEHMDDSKKALLENTLRCGKVLSESLEKIFAAHAVNINTGTYLDKNHTPTTIDKESLTLAIDQLNIGRKVSMQDAALRLSRQDRGDADYALGVPKMREIENIVLNIPEAEMEQYKSQVSALLSVLDDYYRVADSISGKEKVNEEYFTELKRLHSDSIAAMAELSNKMGANDNKTISEMGARLGSMAMKTASFAPAVRNMVTAYFRNAYTNDGAKESLVKDAASLDSRMFEGEHRLREEEYVNTDVGADTMNAERMDNILREAKDYQSDADYMAIVQTAESYENFVATTVLPTRLSILDRESRAEFLGHVAERLQAYNDQLFTMARDYSREHAYEGSNKDKLKLLSRTVFDAGADKFSFFNASRAIYLLKHPEEVDFRIEGDLRTVLRNASVEDAILEGKFHESGGSLSKVYIGEDVVYREGNTYKKQAKGKSGHKELPVNDLDVVKGGVANFAINGTMYVDTRKAARDEACSVVDRLMGAGVIAKSKAVNIIKDGKKLGIGTQMERAAGEEAYRWQRNIVLSPVGASKTEIGVNLLEQIPMTKIYMLQAVDYICGSADRHTGNYFMECEDALHVTSLTAIDNDLSFGENNAPMEDRYDYAKQATDNVNHFYNFTPVLKEAFCCAPKEVYDAVMALTPQALYGELSGLLRDKEIRAAVERLESIQKYFGRLNEAGLVYDLNNAEQLKRCGEETKAKAEELKAHRRDGGPLNYLGVYMNYFALNITPLSEL